MARLVIARNLFQGFLRLVQDVSFNGLSQTRYGTSGHSRKLISWLLASSLTRCDFNRMRALLREIYFLAD